MTTLQLDTYDVDETRLILAGLDVKVSVVSEGLYEAELFQVRVTGARTSVMNAARLLDIDVNEIYED